jgi:glyoxylase-like metal-dependent hydrolase (beta-lactamase superfamily II)
VTSTSDLPWVEPGAFEVAPGVHRVPLPLPNDGLKAVNVYVITTPDGLVCVDAGWGIPESRRLFEQALASLGAGLSDVTRFLVTHVHRDHYTQAVQVRRDAGAKVGLGLGEKNVLTGLQNAHRTPMRGQIEMLRESGAGHLADQIDAWFSKQTVDTSIWESPDEWLTEGPVDLGGRTLQAVETPGHTAGHLVFHDLEAELLFAGDHVLPTITPSIGFEPILSENPLGAFLHSLALVRSRPDAQLLPAHGPVTDSVHRRVDELLAFHDTRLDQTEQGVREGAQTTFEVASALRWTRREHKVADLDVFNAMLAVFETKAHLELLVAQGRLTVTVEEGVRVYSA